VAARARSRSLEGQTIPVTVGGGFRERGVISLLLLLLLLLLL
jgi:hypothetical protein